MQVCYPINQILYNPAPPHSLLTKYEEYTGNDPGLEGIQSICLGRVGSDGIENIDQDKEECD